MPSIETRTKKARIDAMLRKAAVPVLTHVRLIALHHIRSNGKKKCTCGCNSFEAICIKREIIDEKIFDANTGESAFKSACKKKDFEEAAAECGQHLDWNLTVSAVKNQYGISPADLIFDSEATQILASAGVRSGKSESGAMWLAAKIFKHGGPGKVFWIIAPKRNRTHTMMMKFLRVLPPEMLISRPMKVGQDPTIRLFDGTQIGLWHCQRIDDWKGESVQAAWWTEAGSVQDPTAHTTILTRLMDGKGSVWIEGTPEVDAMWMEEKLYDPAMQQNAAIERRKRLLEKVGLTADEQLELEKLANVKPNIKILKISTSLNPWMNLNVIEDIRAQAAAGGANAGEIARQFDGEFRGDREKLFDRFWSKIENVVELSSDNLSVDLGRAKDILQGDDITRRVSRGFFGKEHDWVIGMDANARPQTAVICKIFGKVEDVDSYSLLVYETLRWWDHTAWQAAQELKRYKQGLYSGAGIAIDISAVHGNQSYSIALGQGAPAATRFKEAGFNTIGVFRSFKYRKSAPFEKESMVTVQNLMEKRDGKRRLLVNNIWANPVVRAIEGAEDTGKNTVYAKPHTWGDAHVKAIIDCLRYLSWALFILGQGRINPTTIIT